MPGQGVYPGDRMCRHEGRREPKEESSPGFCRLRGKDVQKQRPFPAGPHTYRRCSSSTPTSLAGGSGRSAHGSGGPAALAPRGRARPYSPCGGTGAQRDGRTRTAGWAGGGAGRGRSAPRASALPRARPVGGRWRRRGPARPAARGAGPGGAGPTARRQRPPRGESGGPRGEWRTWMRHGCPSARIFKGAAGSFGLLFACPPPLPPPVPTPLPPPLVSL